MDKVASATRPDLFLAAKGQYFFAGGNAVPGSGGGC